jgi:hypothetical protein
MIMADLIEFLFAGFIIYILYKLVFGLIVPVSRATSQVRSKMDDMRRAQEEQFYKQQQATHNTSSSSFNKKDTTTTDGEYIDFEEVK